SVPRYYNWGQTYSEPGASSGSGIIVAENENELLIVSNNHVVNGADDLEITFIDGTTAQAVIKGVDVDMDLAVVAVPLDSLSQETRDTITIAALGDSENLKLGEPVIAIGNALGIGQSVTDGIVSALDREITMEDGSKGTFIQTNAEINEGNSGGALLNIRGEVIGINSNKIASTKVEGMGYAIPISSASPIIADLMKDRVPEEEAGYIGIVMQEITDQVIQMYHMPQGVFVYDVEEGSAAHAAGIRKQDIIVKFDDRKITSYNSLKSVLQYYKAGDTATITVMRQENGEYVSYDLEITLGEKPTE
ncbi:MAG: trypsin-like peptidase domain-containing protein, partial [Acetatifactor sp.]|nr:trypsin-like peptidase domain-containing protein [Acetatifactor sp.]